MPQVNIKEYDNIHNWVKRNYGKAEYCEKCGIDKLPDGYKRFFAWANISGKFLRNKDDWQQLCMRCHNRLDSAVLTEKDVLEIRNLYDRYCINQYKLAKKFKVNQSTISRIVNNQRWILV